MTVLPDAALELYKLEYERCAIRYEDIYKAVWTNFSYLAVVAGAILTFGGDRFQPELSIFLACCPLIFWWLATFEPLNRYGDETAARLKEIESIINTKYGTSLGHYTKFSDRRGVRVRWGVRVLGGLLIIVIVVATWKICTLLQGGLPLLYRKSQEAQTMTIDLKDKPLEIKLTDINLNELKRLLEPQEVKMIVIGSKGNLEEVQATSVSPEELKKLLEKTEKKETGKPAGKEDPRRSRR